MPSLNKHNGNDGENGLEEPLLLPAQQDRLALLEEHQLCEYQRQEQQHVRVVDGMPRSTSFLIKTLYFLEALGSSAWGRFGTIYYNLHGLNRQQIGLLEGLMPCVRTLSKPLWGILSDVFHCRKIVYVITNAIGTSILLLLALPFVYSSYTRILCVSLLIMLFSAGGLLDAYTLDLLGSRNKLKYGRYRMWASISWGLGSVLMGYITDHYGFTPNFAIYAVLGVISTCLVAWRIPNVADADKRQEQQGERSSTPPAQPPQEASVFDLLRLLLRPRVAFFLVEVVVVGIGMGTVERLLFLYLVDDLQASTLLCGFSVGVNVLLELPVFWNAKKFTSMLGQDGMMIVSLVCFCVRVFCYTLLTPSTRWWVLTLEVMHGITFACFYVTATNVAKGLISQCPGWNTTIQVGVQTLYDAVGAGIGSIAGGWVMQHYGSRFMYRTMACIMSILLLVHVVGWTVSFRISGQGLLPYYGQDSSTCNDANGNEHHGEQVAHSLNGCEGPIRPEATSSVSCSQE